MRAPSGYLTKNHKIPKYLDEFHPEKHANLVVSQ